MRPTAKQIQQAIDTLQSALAATYGDAAARAGIGEGCSIEVQCAQVQVCDAECCVEDVDSPQAAAQFLANAQRSQAMKHPVTIQLDVDACHLTDTPLPYYCVTMQKGAPYRNRDNYHCTNWDDEPQLITARSVAELYEHMAQERVNFTIYGETQNRASHGDTHDIEDYLIRFSSIFVQVEEYSEARLKATVTYQSIGAARDARRAKERDEAEKARKRAEAYNLRQREEHDKAEFLRLSKKFAK